MLDNFIHCEELLVRHAQNLPVAMAMAADNQKALLFGTAAAVRLILFTVFPSLPILLTGRVEVSTPVTSFKRCMLPLEHEFYQGLGLTGLFLRCSARRAVPLYPQCLSLRRRRFPPGIFLSPHLHLLLTRRHLY